AAYPLSGNESERRALQTPARSLLDLQQLVRRDALVRQLPLTVRQDHLHVHLLGLAQSEVGVGRLPRGVAVARGDLAAAEQRGGLAELALRVNVAARADAHAVDALRPLHLHPQPVAALRLVVQQHRRPIRPPARQEQVEAAVVVVVARRTWSRVDDLLLL